MWHCDLAKWPNGPIFFKSLWSIGFKPFINWNILMFAVNWTRSLTLVSRVSLEYVYKIWSLKSPTVQKFRSSLKYFATDKAILAWRTNVWRTIVVSTASTKILNLGQYCTSEHYRYGFHTSRSLLVILYLVCIPGDKTFQGIYDFDPLTLKLDQLFNELGRMSGS